jgi:hypothetical protein
VIRLAWPDVGSEEAAAVAEVLKSGRLTMGPKVAEFEAELARACGVEHAVAVSSGTAALHLAVLALGIGPGDEVVVPAYTFPATANAVALAGARPVLVDVDPATMNLDPDKVRVTPRTKAILAVHLFGRPAPLERLPDLLVLEDAAGALGARRPMGMALFFVPVANVVLRGAARGGGQASGANNAIRALGGVFGGHVRERAEPGGLGWWRTRRSRGTGRAGHPARGRLRPAEARVEELVPELEATA